LFDYDTDWHILEFERECIIEHLPVSVTGQMECRWWG